MKDLLEWYFLNNSLENYLWVALAVVLVLVLQKYVARLIVSVLFRSLKKWLYDADLNDLVRLLLRPIQLLFLLIACAFIFQTLSYPDIGKQEFWSWNLQELLKGGYEVLVSVSVIWILIRIIDFLTLVLFVEAEKTTTKTDDQALMFLKDVLKLSVLLVGILFILGNIFNLNVSALLAGAGIAGLAIALAAKESLENLFASFIIFLERPFVIEDYVIVSGVEGLVEKVGFRSTRLRTSEKTFVTIPNRQMINNPVDNLSLRTMRRVGFDLGLSYTTSVEQMIQIVSEIKLFLEDYTKDAGNVNVTFSEFGPSALNLYVQYYLKVATWPLYMEKKQEVNFEIMKIVRKNGVSFASTKPTVVINQNA